MILRVWPVWHDRISCDKDRLASVLQPAMAPSAKAFRHRPQQYNLYQSMPSLRNKDCTQFWCISWEMGHKCINWNCLRHCAGKLAFGWRMAWLDGLSERPMHFDKRQEAPAWQPRWPGARPRMPETQTANGTNTMPTSCSQLHCNSQSTTHRQIDANRCTWLESDAAK